MSHEDGIGVDTEVDFLLAELLMARRSQGEA